MSEDFNLYTNRLKLGLTQRQLANILGVTETYISRLEGGKKCISEKFLINYDMKIKELKDGTLSEKERNRKEIANIQSRLGHIEEQLDLLLSHFGQ